MRTLVALALCLFLLASAGVAPVAAASTAATDGPAATGGATAAPQDASPATDAALQRDAGDQNFTYPLTVEIRLRADGDAVVTVQNRYPADTDARRDAFEDVAEQFESEETDLGTGAVDSIETVVPEVAEQTNRSMDVTGRERRAYVEDGVGHLEHRFVWENFGVVEGDRIVVQDAFYTGDGPWLRQLRPNEELVVRGPDGYSVESSETGLRTGNAVAWTVDEGQDEYTFREGEFRTVFVSSEGLLDDLPLLLAGVGLIIIGLVLYLLLDRTDVADAVSVPTPGSPVGEQRKSTSTDGSGGTTHESAAAVGDGDLHTEVDDGEGRDEVDPELLSDEERVEWLLERNGGRMKQASIVEETGWSNAKVSQLLSEMAENDRVDKLRIGRENLITLPDEDVTATD